MALKRIGNWAKANNAAKIVAKLFKAKHRAFLERVADEGLRLLNYHIEENDLPWRPLSPAYAEQKAAEGSDANIYVRTGKFQDSLESGEIANGAGRFIGIPSGAQSDEGDSLADIASIHEFGALSVGIYERPLFRPTMDELVDWAKGENPAGEICEELKNA